MICIDDAIPFEIPQGWEWCKIKHIFSMQAGKFIKANCIQQEQSEIYQYPCFGGNGLRGYVAHYNTDGCYPLIGRQGALCGNVNIAQGRFYATEHAVVTDGYGFTNLDWQFYFLTALNLNQYATATAQPGLAVSNVLEVLIPLPPYEEQIRIGKKINVLLKLACEYEEIQSKLGTTNNQLKIDLRKSILQEAIQGRLVAQNANDEPVTVLFQRIKEEKQRLVNEGKLKKKDIVDSVIFKGDDNKYYEKKNGLVVDISEEIPFEIPDSWAWARMQQICSYIHRGKSPRYSEIRKYPVVAQKCNHWDGFYLEKAQFISPNSLSSYSEEQILQDRDLLWNSTGLGTLGRIGLYPARQNPYNFAVADSHVTVIRSLIKYVRPEYLYYYLSSPAVQNVIEDKSSGSTKQKELATETIKNYLCPIPPIHEQDRIVAQIEKLLNAFK